MLYENFVQLVSTQLNSKHRAHEWIPERPASEALERFLLAFASELL